jgi:hypothetical protein
MAMKPARVSIVGGLALAMLLVGSAPASAEGARDSLWNGFGWGFLAGFGYGTVTFPGYLTYDALGWDRCRSGPNLTCSVPFGLVGGGIGALIDWRIKDSPLTITPEASRARKALHVSVRF